MDQIEVEARAYIEAYSDDYWQGESTRYLRAMLAALDARDAEIDRLREQNHFFQAQYQDEAGINALSEQLVAAKAEIARLVSVLDSHAETMHPWYGPCDEFVDGRCAECERVIAAMRAPPRTDVIERAKRLIVELCGGESVRDDDSDIIPTARALQQYGDERARKAREEAIEQAAEICEDGNSYFSPWACACDIRALTAKPGSET